MLAALSRRVLSTGSTAPAAARRTLAYAIQPSLLTPAPVWASRWLTAVGSVLGLPITSSLTDILKEAFLWAVPKKKTTHSRSRMRQSNKALKDRHDIHTCPACGKNKLSHHICLYCYSELKQKYREFKDAHNMP